jgi:hypothetical protein
MFQTSQAHHFYQLLLHHDGSPPWHWQTGRTSPTGHGSSGVGKLHQRSARTRHVLGGVMHASPTTMHGGTGSRRFPFRPYVSLPPAKCGGVRGFELCFGSDRCVETAGGRRSRPASHVLPYGSFIWMVVLFYLAGCHFCRTLLARTYRWRLDDGLYIGIHSTWVRAGGGRPYAVVHDGETLFLVYGHVQIKVCVWDWEEELRKTHRLIIVHALVHCQLNHTCNHSPCLISSLIVFSLTFFRRGAHLFVGTCG